MLLYVSPKFSVDDFANMAGRQHKASCNICLGRSGTICCTHSFYLCFAKFGIVMGLSALRAPALRRIVHILGMSPFAHVARPYPHTCRIVTIMKKVRSWFSAHLEIKSKPMSQIGTILMAESSVSISGGTRPDPAFVGFDDVFPEPLFNSDFWPSLMTMTKNVPHWPPLHMAKLLVGSTGYRGWSPTTAFT